MARLLITGGSGYLGSHIARQAAGAAQVVATYLNHPVSLPGCQCVPLDVRDAGAVGVLVAGVRPDAVIHTAFAQGEPEEMRASIERGTANVARAAAAAGAHLVHLSSDMVFDGERAPYSETDLPAPITPYGRAKAAAEETVSALCPGASVVRTSLICGFDPPDPRTAWVMQSMIRERPITLFTDEIRSPVWVVQLAAALLELAFLRQGGIWHLAGAEAISRCELGVRLVRAYGLDPAGITPGASRDSGLLRPRDLTLDTGKARGALRSPLWGIGAVLSARPPGLRPLGP